MSDFHKKKRFLNLPKYIGGSQEFRDFISKNLSYPPTALEAGIEGIVIVEYDISDEGTVLNPHILKGLGYGCDEEAVRVVSLLRFEKVRNRGVRVTMTTKTTITFKLPGFNIHYEITKKEETGKQQNGQVEKTLPLNYHYTIQISEVNNPHS